RRRHTRCLSDWSSDVCSSDLEEGIYIEYSLAHGKIQWAVGAGAQPNPLDFDSRELPPFAGVQPPGPLAVSYDQKRLGQWAPPPRSEERRVGKECRARCAPECE